MTTPPSTPQIENPATQTSSIPTSSQEQGNPFVLNHTSGNFFLPADSNDPTSTLLSFTSQMLLPSAFPGIANTWTSEGPFPQASHLEPNAAASWDEHGRSFNSDVFFQVCHTKVRAAASITRHLTYLSLDRMRLLSLCQHRMHLRHIIFHHISQHNQRLQRQAPLWKMDLLQLRLKLLLQLPNDRSSVKTG